MIKNINVDVDGKSLLVMVITLKDRNIICIPTMIGCPVKCDFCISSTNKFERSLSASEMVGLFSEGYKSINPSNPTMLSFTGEGEPLLNIKNVNTALSVLDNDERVQSYRIVTSGIKSRLVSKIRDSIKPINLQFSMHSTNDKDRRELIQYTDDLSVILGNITNHQDKFEEIAVNYVLMKGVNDSSKHLDEFVSKVPQNWFIKLNPLIEGTPKYEKSDYKNYWESKLRSNGFEVKSYSKIGSTIGNNFYSELTYRKSQNLITSKAG